MRLTVTVTPNARATRVEQLDAGHVRVAVTAPPREGRANEAVREALAKYFRVPRSAVRIIRGAAGRHKIVEIAEIR